MSSLEQQQFTCIRCYLLTYHLISLELFSVVAEKEKNAPKVGQ
jgi:hypothetical protein